MQYKLSPFFIVSLLAVFALVGCGPQVQTGAEAGVNFEFEAMGDSQMVGETMLMVTLTDSSGAPINDATLNVQGDMTHAGMAPVIRDVEGGEDGVYSVPFEWTMGGDWIVTVLAVLNDGTEVEESFDLSVASAGEMAMDHDSHGDGEMAMDMDADLVAAVEALDVTSIHEIDVALNEDGTMDAGYAETVGNFAMAFSMISWPEMQSEGVDSANASLMSLKEALEAEDLDAAKSLATEAHDYIHDVVEAILEPGKDHAHDN